VKYAYTLTIQVPPQNDVKVKFTVIRKGQLSQEQLLRIGTTAYALRIKRIDIRYGSSKHPSATLVITSGAPASTRTFQRNAGRDSPWKELI